MSYLPSSPGNTNLPDIFMKVPTRATLMLRLADEILRGDSPLSIGERELIFAYGSAQNACSFCYDSHKPVAAAFGIDEDVFDGLIADIDSSSVDEKLKPVLKYVKKLTLSPSRISQTDVDPILAAGWDEQALIDIASICALHNFYNRFVDGLGVEVGHEEARRTGAELLPTIGYAGLAEQLEGLK